MEVCPSCGDFVSELRSVTGWCDECSGTTDNVCIDCGKSFENDGNRKRCSTCRHWNWIVRNADAIEEYIKQAYTLKESIAQVKEDNKPQCKNCGTTITKGIFCMDKIECRRAYHRYHSYRYFGQDEDTALRRAIREAS